MDHSDTINDTLLEDLSDGMRCFAIASDQGDVLLVHDQDLPSKVQWVEYDVSLDDFMIIHEEGRIQNLGVELKDDIRENLKKSKEIVVAHAQNKKLINPQVVSLVIKDY